MNEAKKDYHAPMHSAEHILNQTMVRMFGCGRSFSNHIERKKSKCDYKFTRALTAEEEEVIMARVNEIIDKHLPVSETFINRAEAQAQFNLEKLPDDAGDTIRVITIGDYDACPCIGQHVDNTSEIGRFRIVSTDYNDGVLRIRYKLEQKE